MRNISEIDSEIKYMNNKIIDVQLGIVHGRHELYGNDVNGKLPTKQWFVDIYGAYVSYLGIIKNMIEKNIVLSDNALIGGPDMLCYCSGIWDNETKDKAMSQAKAYALSYALGEESWFDRELAYQLSL